MCETTEIEREEKTKQKQNKKHVEKIYALVSAPALKHARTRKWDATARRKVLLKRPPAVMDWFAPKRRPNRARSALDSRNRPASWQGNHETAAVLIRHRRDPGHIRAD